MTLFDRPLFRPAPRRRTRDDNKPQRKNRAPLRSRPLSAELLETRCLLSAGELDPNFGLAGTAMIPVAPFAGVDSDGIPGSNTNDAVVQPNGSIVEVGWYSSGTRERGVAIGRLLADGSVDTTFGDDGKVIWGPTGGDNEALAVAITPTNKILLEGQILPDNGTGYDGQFLLQLNSDGSVDTSFGTDGVVESSAVGGPLLVAPDGQFYTGVTRFNVDGSVDAGFQAAAIPAPVTWRAIALDGQGRLVATGYSNPGNGTEMVVGRYLSNGNLDTTFNPGLFTGPLL